MYRIVRSFEEIDGVLGETIDEGRGSRWPGMSYEQGVEAALLWVTGQTDENPMEG